MSQFKSQLNVTCLFATNEDIPNTLMPLKTTPINHNCAEKVKNQLEFFFFSSWIYELQIKANPLRATGNNICRYKLFI